MHKKKVQKCDFSNQNNYVSLLPKIAETIKTNHKISINKKKKISHFIVEPREAASTNN